MTIKVPPDPTTASSSVVFFQGRSTAGMPLTTANQWYPVTLAVEDFDTDNAHTAGSSRFVAPRADRYLVSGTVHVANGTTGGLRQLALWRNGTIVPGAVAGAPYTTAGSILTLHLPRITVSLALNDYIELQVQSAAASATALGSTTDYGSVFSVESRAA